MTEAAEDFWRFSLALYARPGVAPACLVLQDEQARDVNLALYCCWVGASGRGGLEQAKIAQAEAAAAPWRQGVIEPLRAARRSLKGVAGAEALYAKIKTLELEAERRAQEVLAGLAPVPITPAPTPPERQAAAAANLALYLGEPATPVAAPIYAALRAGGPA